MIGASGAIGSRLVPQLIEAGHDIVGSHRSRTSAELVRALGAEPIEIDVLDGGAVHEAVAGIEPDADRPSGDRSDECKFLPELGSQLQRDQPAPDRSHRRPPCSRPQDRGRRFVAQSYANFRYEREGGPVKAEDDPLDPRPVETMAETVGALRYLEEAVTKAGGIVLRYGNFYGAANDGLIEPVSKRQFPIVGDGDGVSSFIHLADAAAATALALQHDGPAIYNIVDDDPAPVREWLPVLADALGAEPPRHFPRWLARHLRRRGRCDVGNRGSRRVERQGQARAWLAAALPELAPGLRRGICDDGGGATSARCLRARRDVRPPFIRFRRRLTGSHAAWASVLLAEPAFRAC